MRSFLLFLSILIISSSITAQTKYFVYFKDKGVSPTAPLQKSSSLFSVTEKQLSPKAIERRKLVMGENNYITYEDLPLNENYIHQIEALGIKIENQLKWFNAVTSYLTDEQVNQIKQMPFVEKVERVYVFRSPKDEKVIETSNKTLEPINSVQSSVGLNYGPSLTQAALSDVPAVHDLGINGNGVTIGLLDTGFRWKLHNSLKNLLVLNEKDFIQNDGITENQSGDASNQDAHGTAVFSIMAGLDQGNIVGPAYGAQFLLAKTEYVPSETHTEEDNYAAALEWMENLGVDITSSSLGYTLFDVGQSSYTYADMNGQTTIVAKAANLAFDRGVSTFTAAGNYFNDGWWIINSPADAFNIISVGAVTSANILASFSLPGPTADGRIKPEIVAMGVSNFHAVAGGTYGSGSGTSYAAPIAAGIAALLKSAWPHLTNTQIREIFLKCGDNAFTPNNGRGYGLISAARVVSYPNLSRVNLSFKLNKIFMEPNSIDRSNVVVNYRIDSGQFKTAVLQPDDAIKFFLLIPELVDKSLLEFYFTYKKNGIEMREPLQGYYKMDDQSIVGNETNIPAEFSLYQNFPNPFNSTTVIAYELKDYGHVRLKVFNILGQEVRTLVDQIQQPGFHQVRYNSSDHQVSSGVYIYSLSVGNYFIAKKMLLLK